MIPIIQKTFTFKQYAVPVYELNTVVVGTGAAGYNAANRLAGYGQTDICIVTEHINSGTSRNTGSDKQTYYKLTLAGGDGDSVREMAETLFSGQCMDGDHALCEAALSPQGFLNLVELGVPFPRNRYGEFIGYKTDHDPRRRATSAGPYTSKMMTQCLEQECRKNQISVFDNMQVIKIIKKDNAVCGLLCLNLAEKDEIHRFTAFICKNIVYATGGPAGMYADSVYPNGHSGASGTAFMAGAKGKNLTEWQFGLASISPRWNVSGTYMQALPRFISTDKDLGDEREFLYDFFREESEMLNMIFLKGYQWPFDVRKISDGSSLIDILVYMETSKGRRVFLDYRDNPDAHSIDFNSLSEEVFQYLDSASACFGTPYQRLLHMNAPAVDFYMDKGVDLKTQMLEISLCAQHNNGGLDVDCWWQTSLEGFFAVGEAAGSHGVYRPGGSALNSGQVGSTRAAQYISACRNGGSLSAEEYSEILSAAVSQSDTLSASALCGESNIKNLLKHYTSHMSIYAGAFRNKDTINEFIDELTDAINNFSSIVKVKSPFELGDVFKLWDILHSQLLYVSAMSDYISQWGKSRGSALYTDETAQKPYSELPDMFKFILDDESRKNLVQISALEDTNCKFNWREVRKIPEDDDFFENVWRDYREHKNIY